MSKAMNYLKRIAALGLVWSVLLSTLPAYALEELPPEDAAPQLTEQLSEETALPEDTERDAGETAPADETDETSPLPETNDEAGPAEETEQPAGESSEDTDADVAEDVDAVEDAETLLPVNAGQEEVRAEAADATAGATYIYVAGKQKAGLKNKNLYRIYLTESFFCVTQQQKTTMEKEGNTSLLPLTVTIPYTTDNVVLAVNESDENDKIIVGDQGENKQTVTVKSWTCISQSDTNYVAVYGYLDQVTDVDGVTVKNPDSNPQNSGIYLFIPVAYTDNPTVSLAACATLTNGGGSYNNTCEEDLTVQRLDATESKYYNNANFLVVAPYSATSVTLEATPEDQYTTVKPVQAKAGVADSGISSAGGADTIAFSTGWVEVVLPVETAKGTIVEYIVAITRHEEGGDRLSGFTVETAGIEYVSTPSDPKPTEFRPGSSTATETYAQRDYTLMAPLSADKITVTPVLEGTGTIQINGQVCTSGESYTFNLGDPGETTVLEVLAIPKNSMLRLPGRYTFSITRKTDHRLQALSLLSPNESGGKIIPIFSEFDPAKTTYETVVDYDIDGVQLVTEPLNANATVTAKVVKDGVKESVTLREIIPLETGDNVIEITVVDPGFASGQTYTITVKREKNVPKRYLNSLQIWTSGSASNVLDYFTPQNNSYDVKETNINAAQITIGAEPYYDGDSVTVTSNGSEVSAQESGFYFVPLNATGDTPIRITVTDKDDPSNTFVYYLTVSKVAADDIPKLTNLTVTGAGISGLSGEPTAERMLLDCPTDNTLYLTATASQGTVSVAVDDAVCTADENGAYTLDVTNAGQVKITVDNNGVVTRYSVFLGNFAFAETITDAAYGQAYSCSLATLNGACAYSFALTGSSTMPAGLSLDETTGKISGVPTKAGTYQFTVSVTERFNGEVSQTRSQNVTLEVKPQEIKLQVPTLTKTYDGGTSIETKSPTGVTGLIGGDTMEMLGVTSSGTAVLASAAMGTHAVSGVEWSISNENYVLTQPELSGVVYPARLSNVVTDTQAAVGWALNELSGLVREKLTGIDGAEVAGELVWKDDGEIPGSYVLSQEGRYNYSWEFTISDSNYVSPSGTNQCSGTLQVDVAAKTALGWAAGNEAYVREVGADGSASYHIAYSANDESTRAALNGYTAHDEALNYVLEEGVHYNVEYCKLENDAWGAWTSNVPHDAGQYLMRFVATDAPLTARYSLPNQTEITVEPFDLGELAIGKTYGEPDQDLEAMMEEVKTRLIGGDTWETAFSGGLAVPDLGTATEAGSYPINTTLQAKNYSLDIPEFYVIKGAEVDTSQVVISGKDKQKIGQLRTPNELLGVKGPRGEDEKAEVLSGTFSWDGGDDQEVVVGESYAWTFTFDETQPNYDPTTAVHGIAVIEKDTDEDVIYSVRFEKGEHGTISGLRSVPVFELSTIPFTPEIIPEEGWIFLGWSMDGETVVDLKSLKVRQSLTLTALYAQETDPETLPAYQIFSDVAEDDWFADCVDYAYRNSLLIGVGDGEFAPHLGMTRAMMATLMMRMAGATATGAVPTFPDVAADAWYSDAVAWAQSAGVMVGNENGEFEPERVCTRAEMALLLHRYHQIIGITGALMSGQNVMEDFADAECVPDWAVASMTWALDVGMMQGFDDLISPDTAVTRAQVAMILQRMLLGT